MSGEQSAVDVFLLAENRLLRDVFARLLARKSDIHVAGVAAITAQIVLEVVAAEPDVILCDSLAAALSSDASRVASSETFSVSIF